MVFETVLRCQERVFAKMKSCVQLKEVVSVPENRIRNVRMCTSDDSVLNIKTLLVTYQILLKQKHS